MATPSWVPAVQRLLPFLRARGEHAERKSWNDGFRGLQERILHRPRDFRRRQSFECLGSLQEMAMYTRRSLEQFSEIHQTEGALEALRYLNAGVPHRYTAVYELLPNVLKNVALFDKVGEMQPDFLAEVPFEDSFCKFVVRDGLFRTTDSALDSRLNGHPYQGVVLSYHGAPIVWRKEVWGTICHFDLAEQALADDEFELLKAAANAWPNATPSVHTGAMPLGDY
jgi:GAF domain-containing protein